MVAPSLVRGVSEGRTTRVARWRINLTPKPHRGFNLRLDENDLRTIRGKSLVVLLCSKTLQETTKD